MNLTILKDLLIYNIYDIYAIYYIIGDELCLAVSLAHRLARNDTWPKLGVQFQV